MQVRFLACDSLFVIGWKVYFLNVESKTENVRCDGRSGLHCPCSAGTLCQSGNRPRGHGGVDAVHPVCYGRVLCVWVRPGADFVV